MVELKLLLKLTFSCSATFKMGRIQLGTVFIVLITLRLSRAGVPGTFFWKPRMAVDLSVPTYTGPPNPVRPPTDQNIRSGYVVMVEGYRAGLTAVAIAVALEDRVPHPHLDPYRASYYTNMYRWTLRYLSLLPTWLGGFGGYADTHKVWRRRFYYMDKLVPLWLREYLPVEEWDWVKEEKDLARFNIYAEPAFGKHYQYPSKRFNNFRSDWKKETVENMNRSFVSIRLSLWN